MGMTRDRNRKAFVANIVLAPHLMVADAAANRCSTADAELPAALSAVCDVN